MKRGVFLLLISLPLGCEEEERPSLLELETSVRALPKSAGGVNGAFDYCHQSVCNAGEGDCDRNLDCAAGLVCVADNGPAFGAPADYDFCAPTHCANRVLDTAAGEVAIDAGGPCGALVCPGTNGTARFCTPACPCSVGQGDCDTRLDCAAGLVCGINNAERFGIPEPLFEVCVEPHCANRRRDVDELDVDCGGADCGSCGVTMEDLVAPRLTAFSLSATSIDIRSAPATETVNISVSDELSGITRAMVTLRGPTGPQARYCVLEPTGAPLVLSTSCALEFQRFGEAGVWNADVTLYDSVGNIRSLDATAIQALGFNPALQVLSTQDITAPNVTALALQPAAIDTSAQTAAATVDFSIADDLSGIVRAIVTIRSPIGPQARYCVREVTGSPTMWTSSCVIEFPRFGEAGDWRVDITLYDVAGNIRFVTPASLEASGFAATLPVTSIPDTNAPTLTAFTFSPTSIDTSSGSPNVAVSLSIADDLAGISHVSVTFRTPTGPQGRYCLITLSAAPVALNTGCTVEFEQFGATGAWTADVVLYDVLGNNRTLVGSALAALGFNATLIAH